MSDFDAGDSGYDAGHDGGSDFGHYEAGHEHDALNQLHQDHGSESDYNNQFGNYEADHHAAAYAG